jgi:hypothetical protein
MQPIDHNQSKATMLLTILTLTIIATFTTNSHLLKLILNTITIGYYIALSSVTIHKHKLNHINFNLHLHPH